MGPGSSWYSVDSDKSEFFRNYRLFTGFGLDKCLLRLREMFPHLTRSSLYRCFRREGVSRVPWTKRFEMIGEGLVVPGRLYVSIYGGGDSALFTAIEVGSGRICCQRSECSPEQGVIFLEKLVECFPDGGVFVFTKEKDDDLFKYPEPAAEPKDPARHPFALACKRHGVRHFPYIDMEDESVRPGVVRIRKRDKALEE
jgi:hypothetical protein